MPAPLAERIDEKMKNIDLDGNDMVTPFTGIATTLGVKEETVFALEFYCLVRNMIEAALLKHRSNPDLIKDQALRDGYAEDAAYRVFSKLIDSPRLCRYLNELAQKQVEEFNARAATHK